MLSNESFNYEDNSDDSSPEITLEEAYYLGLEVFSYKFKQLDDSEKTRFFDRLKSLG